MKRTKGSSITINFHSRRREETYVKAKKNVQNFRRQASLHISMFKLILHAKAKT